ncbi:hypothetical protein CYMTET_10767 [Cymbomonas tetramitiformis]|uniref:Intraflagellar transport protein 140 n=1 Tax=Cymbomonas tetramitiformis TaxID=36881 RepID=A0AAE0LE48_9CHLO|nr:hypothetical protein CYMTET_10767 [Cymbomonas tetramitiformis]
MAIYFANRVALGNARGNPVCSAWSKVKGESPLLGISCTGGTVGIYTDEGEPLDKENDPPIKSSRGADAEVLSWHPTMKLLAIGWKDGTLSFWSEAERRVSEDKQTHSSAITCLEWSEDGSRLLTGDEGGKVGVWKTDARGRPVPMVQYHERDAKITHICFRSVDPSDAASQPPEPPKEDGAAAELPAVIFYYGILTQEKGVVCQGDDKGHKGHLYEVDTDLVALLYYKEKGALVALSRSSTLTVHAPKDSSWVSLVKAKLPTMEGVSSLQVTWAGKHVLASASDKDSMVRMFNLNTEENFVLMMGEENAMKKVSSLAFNTATNSLAAGTKEGRVAMWKFVGAESDSTEGDSSRNPEDDWQLLPGVSLGSKVTALSWGPNMRLLVGVCMDGVYIMSKCVLQHKIRDKNAVVQLSADKVVIESCDPTAQAGSSAQRLLTTSMQITGVDCTETHVLLWNGKKAEVYELARDDVRMVSTFPSAASSMAIFKESVFRTNDSRVEVCNLQGTVKQTLVFDEVHGKAQHLNVNGEYLAVTSTKSYLKMWKISGREAKQHGPGPGRRIELGDGDELGEVESLQVNCSGSKVSFILTSSENQAKVDSRIIVYDVEMDNFSAFDFKSQKRYPEAHFWDADEPKLLAVESRMDAANHAENDSMGLDTQEVEVTTLFSTPDDGVLFQEQHQLDPEMEGCVGLKVPFIFFFKKVQGDMGGAQMDGPCVKSGVMRDFTGLESVDDKTRQALLNFSYHLAVGNMDDAYKAVKLIKNPNVWENMAHMCIKTKRLDVAEHCLGNMGHIRGARAIREASEYKEIDARVGTVAVQLGLIQDAAKLFVACDRYDLLNNLHQSCGEWEKAIEVAQKHDRIHLRTTYYNHARHLESIGDTPGATSAYEMSETHRAEVPRMLYENNMLEELEEYINTTQDKKLMKWWARYCESSGMFDKALECYQTAGDYLALVRVHCYRGSFQEASEIAAESNDGAAAFHLARQFENQERIPEAIQFFARAQRYNHAIRLSKKHGMDNELMNLALQSNQRSLMVESAHYFEEKDMCEKAVLLYQKGGNVERALDLCFRAQLFESLRTIADDLGDDTDPAILMRCADFFLEHGQFGKAVHLLVAAKDFEKALNLSIEHNILITEDMAEAMTPNKDQGTAEERTNLLRRIGKCCKRQGSFHLACKKYTQAGDKVKAMKVLLKSGDTEKVIFFAGVSRQKEIYIMAANYLQTLDWHNDAEIMKSIIQFYTKAKAMDSLSSFYEACAQIEIDEYRDYEKALGALREATKFMAKAQRTSPDKDERLASLNQRISLCDKFVQARKLIKTDPQEMVRICSGLLEYPPEDSHDVESAIRVGDVFALLVEYYQSTQNYEQAYHLIEKMRDRNIILSPYLDQEMVESVYKAMGVPLNDTRQQADDGEDTVGEEIDGEA